MQNYISNIHTDYWGNGRSGFRDNMLSFVDKFEAVEKEQEKVNARRHEENSDKMTRIANLLQGLILVVSILGLLVAAVGAIYGIVEAHRAGITPINIFGPNKSGKVYSDASNQQSAGDETIR